MHCDIYRNGCSYFKRFGHSPKANETILHVEEEKRVDDGEEMVDWKMN